MSGRGWLEVVAQPPAPSRTIALAYVSPSQDVALWNDYESYRTLLVAHPRLGSADAALSGRWSVGANGPGAIADEERVEGYGTFTFPYGPVAMGVNEAGAFDLRTYGERVLEVTTLVGHKHRGVEAAILGRTPEDATLWIERRVGPYALSHVATFLGAVESALGRPVPQRELWTRALLQELQRIYNHLRVIARVAEAASQNVGTAQLQILVEDLLRMLGRFTGHRWGFGALLPGHAPLRLGAEDRRDLFERLTALHREFDGLWESLLTSRTLVDRLQSTGILSERDAIRLAVVGPALRASRVAWDDRLRSPEFPYTDLFVSIPREDGGDALARVLMRREEIRASLLLIEQLLDRWSSARGAEWAPPAPIAPQRGIARGEGPSGDLVYDVSLQEGRVRSIGVRTPSQANWPAIAHCLRGGVFTDFSFALESFGSSFAESDG